MKQISSSPLKPFRSNRKPRLRSRRRRGIAALWVILVTPAFLLLLCFVADIGKLWLARTELENGLEAAALAGVRSWGEASGGPTAAARGTAVEYAAANVAAGQTISIASNFGPLSPPNENASATGDLLFGSATQAGNAWIFDSNGTPDCNLGRPYAVRAQGSATVTSFSDGFLGMSVGPYAVSAETTAIYDCTLMQPRIVASP